MMNSFLKITTCLSFSLVLSEGVKAEDDILQVTPFATTAGITENDWDYAFTVQMNNTQAYTAIQFDILLPPGMTLIPDEPLELLQDRFPGTVKKGVFYPEHNISVSDQGNGLYRIVLYHDEFAPIEGDSGDLMVFYYLTSADMAPGYYPIKVTGTVLAVNAHNDYKPETSTSYVKIGEPGEDATLTMEGLIPSFVNEALALETGLKTLDCSKVTGMDGTFSLVDGRNFIAPTEDATAQTVTYHRSCPSNKWGTACLPFSVESDAYVQYFRLMEVEAGKLTFEPVASVEAGVPTVFKILNGDALDVSVDNAVVRGGECSTTFDNVNWTMKGSYSQINLTPEAPENQTVDQYYISMDKFWYNNVEVLLDAFRGWFEAPMAVRAPAFSINEHDNNTTGIDFIEKVDGTVEMKFDMGGRQLPYAIKGINIINNKKIIIR
ncbi:MAG: hypothetical protein ACI4BA_02545 [Prevotella sp.]